MENSETFRDAELHFVYRHRRRLLLVECFQEKFEIVKTFLEKCRAQLSSVVLPIKSRSFSRHFNKSVEHRRIEGEKNDVHHRFSFLLFVSSGNTGCIITVDENFDSSAQNSLQVKILGRSTEKTTKAQQMIKEFEEKNYSSRRIYPTQIEIFNDENVRHFSFLFVNFHVFVFFRSICYKKNVEIKMFSVRSIDQIRKSKSKV